MSASHRALFQRKGWAFVAVAFVGYLVLVSCSSSNASGETDVPHYSATEFDVALEDEKAAQWNSLSLEKKAEQREQEASSYLDEYDVSAETARLVETCRHVDVSTFEPLVSSGCFVLDIQPAQYWTEATINGSTHITVGGQLGTRSDELPSGQDIYLIDYAGENWSMACAILVDNGISPSQLVVVDGGMQAWISAGLDTIKPKFGCGR